MLKDNEIVVSAQAVKYHDIEYLEKYIIITQNRIRRRVYNGYYFEDTGSHIYVSNYYSAMFQHKNKSRQFIVNTVTKEWREFQSIIILKHKPVKKEPVNNAPHADLIR